MFFDWWYYWLFSISNVTWMLADIMTESSCCCQRSDTELRTQISYNGFVGIVGWWLWELVTIFMLKVKMVWSILCEWLLWGYDWTCCHVSIQNCSASCSYWLFYCGFIQVLPFWVIHSTQFWRTLSFEVMSMEISQLSWGLFLYIFIHICS
jgi:hypothetical protein